MMNSYQQLLKTIEEVKSTGKKVTVTVLPSQVNRKRKSLLWVTFTIWPEHVIKLFIIHTHLHEHMSRELMISLLRKGNTGEQILDILDSLVADTDNTEPATFTAEPTLYELEFWSLKGCG